jgi:hypothetical protein
MQEACAMKLLQTRIEIPKICDTRIVQLTHTIWTQLEQRNEWIYFIPLSDSITILCPDKNLIDITLTGNGKLMIQPNCKGYSLTALLATKNDIQTNITKYGGDLLSKVETQFECCKNFGVSKNLSHLQLELNFKHVVSPMEDLKYASYKVSELEEKIKETAWKHQYTKSHSTYSVSVYILTTLVSICDL